ncbi:MAG: outer membrane protein assembly factor BamA [Deltaproteobacteria bacterium]|nr:outer membrane protein assembly factor BamA [Deltaproteobacteria bacterium]
MNKKTLYAALLTLFMALVFTNTVLSAQDKKTVAIFPFEVHSKANKAYLQENIYSHLYSELEKSKSLIIIKKDVILQAVEKKSIDEPLAIETAKSTGAGYIIMGSISELGEQISVDAKIMEVDSRKVIAVITDEGQGLESIGRMASNLKSSVLLSLSSGQRVARLEYKGNRKIESSAINQVMKTTIGSLFSEADLSSDIKAIYKMGYFNNVAAEVTDTPEGKVITFILEEKGLVTEIVFRGNKALNKKDLEGVLSIKTRQILNQEKIKADIEKMKALYDSKGYYNAEIDHAIEKEGEKDMRLVFNIKEYTKIYIRNIGFEGNSAYTHKELKKIMSTQEKGFFSFFTESGVLKRDILKQDAGKLNAYYLNNGFINAQVGEPEITHDQKGIYIKIPVTEGKRYRVGKIAMTGDELKIARPKLLEKLQINKKEFYDREAIMKDMDYLTEICNDEGYAYADIVPRTLIQEKDQTVDVTYQISKGMQVYFNRISITGNTKTRDKVIRRQLAIVEGDLFSRSNLKKSYMALNRLRYFEEVDFQTAKGPDDSLTDVNIRVREKQTGMFSIGAGYSALEHAVLTAQITQQNLFGRGQTLSLKANVSSISTSYELSFSEPWLFDIPLWSSFSLWNATREYDSYNLDSQGFGATFGYPLFEYVTGYIGYRLTRDHIKDIDETLASLYVKEQAGITTSSMVSGSLIRDTTDDIVFPSKGSKNTASVEYTGGFLGGDNAFTRYNLTSAWFFPLPLDTVFGLRGRIGYLEGNGGKKVPIYERYYLGGISSLRGLRNVGPTDPATGDFVGGLTMLNFNVEFLFPLLKDAGMRGVVFFDTGNAWETGYHFGDMRKTAGAGIRWYSPIGPFRLEWGHVLDRKPGESSSRWEFTIGMFM